MNPLIKIINIVALLIVPLMMQIHGDKAGGASTQGSAAPAAVVATAAVGAGAAAGAAATAPTAATPADTAAKSDAAMLAAAQSASDAASVKTEGGVVKFYFASGKADLAAGGKDALVEVVKGVMAGKKAVISGFVDGSGDPVKNADLAKQRAFAVRDLLKIIGVPEDKIELKKPEDIKAGATSASEGRRVEVTLQ